MATDLHRGLTWRGGALNLGVLLTWGLNTSGRSMQELTPIDWVEAFRTLPLSDTAEEAAQDLAFWRDWLAHPDEGRLLGRGRLRAAPRRHGPCRR